ncbi:MAG: hypothetical protein ABEJ40_11565 [Haloarculaceae archaeon]
MTANWDAPTEDYSGDVRLSGRHEPPVGLRDTEDVFVGPGAVDGTLRLDDAEYAFTDVPVDGDGEDAAERSAGDVSVGTAVVGDEDGYVEDVDGDVVLRGVEDVFVAAGAAGALDATGAEQVFHDGAATPTDSPAAYDVTLTGWNHSREARDPRDGVSIRGAKNEVRVTEASHDLTVYVVGWDNEVRIEGRDADVTVFFVGRDNRVTVGPYLSVTKAAESGFDNAVEAEPLPPEAVIQTSKDEAFADATIGRHKVTWQEPAKDKDWCPNCGTEADAIVERRQKDAFFLFRVPVRTYDDGGVSYECEECSPHAVGDVALSEAERESALR